jgi:putative membrane protein
MKKIVSTGLLLSAFIFGVVSCDQKQGAVEEAQEQNEEMAEDSKMEDQIEEMSEFMTKAASGGMMEVELGKLAQQQAQMKEVKDFAAMMVKDHENVNNELKALAAKHNIALPDSMSNDHMDHIKNMRDKKGLDFDKAYMSLMVEDHEEDIDLFESASTNSEIENTEVKAFANKTLQALRQHHERAKQVKDMVDKRK